MNGLLTNEKMSVTLLVAIDAFAPGGTCTAWHK